MTRTFTIKRMLTVVLALIVVWAPVLPSFAMTLAAGDAHAVHASHDSHDGNVQDHSAPKQSPCTQHDSCSGQCCDICAQCFNAVSPVPLDQTHLHPVQTPVLTKLHPRILVASPDRPPRFLSL